MIIRLNMVGHFTRDINLDSCPRVNEIISYTDVHKCDKRILIGKIRHIEHLYDANSESHVVIVVCDVRNHT